MSTKPQAKLNATVAPVVPEADFNDTIAHTRALTLLDPALVPAVPAGYRPPDADTRVRRLRRLAGDLRAEAVEALDEAGARDLKAELGKFAPDPARAADSSARLGVTEHLVARAQALLEYAREVDQIALSDALLFLEAENKQLQNAIEHEPGLTTEYRKLIALFEARSGAITEGIARKSEQEKSVKEGKAGEAKAPADGKPADARTDKPE